MRSAFLSVLGKLRPKNLGKWKVRPRMQQAEAVQSPGSQRLRKDPQIREVCTQPGPVKGQKSQALEWPGTQSPLGRRQMLAGTLSPHSQSPSLALQPGSATPHDPQAMTPSAWKPFPFLPEVSTFRLPWHLLPGAFLALTATAQGQKVPDALTPFIAPASCPLSTAAVHPAYLALARDQGLLRAGSGLTQPCTPSVAVTFMFMENVGEPATVAEGKEQVSSQGSKAQECLPPPSALPRAQPHQRPQEPGSHRQGCLHEVTQGISS